MEYDVRLEQLGSRPLAVVRRRASLQELARVVPELAAWCGASSAQKIMGAGRHVALYWDDQINLEVGVELETPFAGHGEVVGSATPAGAVATSTHFGPYDRLHEAHEAVRQWWANQGYVLAAQLGNLRPLDGRMGFRPGEDPHGCLLPAEDRRGGDGLNLAMRNVPGL